MILFTKEIFINLKTLTMMHIHVQAASSLNGNIQEAWQIYIQGISKDLHSPHGDIFSTYIGVASKEDAYKIFGELVKQVVDSGDVPELNTKLVDDVIKEP
jgi:predicted secreted Zn-dependent protease